MIIQKDYPLPEALWYKTGPRAKYLITCTSKNDITEALEFVENNKIQRTVVIGKGSNLIFTEDYFDGAIIRIAQEKKQVKNYHKKGEFITVFAGVILDDLIRYTFANKLAGLEWAGGLPGTIASAIRGNAGAFGKEIKDSVESVEVLEKNNFKYHTRVIYKADLEFSYRNSLVKKNKNLIITSATFKLRTVNDEYIANAQNIYLANINYRKEHHPVEYPTCGSVFKNIIEPEEINKILAVWPELKDTVSGKWHGKVSMGYLINKLGISGMRRGNMQVSTKHANFIINLGGGKARDALVIIEDIQRRMYDAFGFVPELEAEII